MGFIKWPQIYSAEAEKLKGGIFNDRKCINPLYRSERERDKEGEREKEGEKKGGRERERGREKTGALAPFSYLVYI